MSQGSGNLQLISVHLPKCAGTSFQAMLQANYAESTFARVDIRLATKQLVYNGQFSEIQLLPAHLKAIHGHFHLNDFHHRFTGYEKVPAIVCLRNPIQRFLSDYRYMQQLLREFVDQKKYPNLIKRMQKNLIEFAQEPANRNSMSRFLKDLEFRRFSYIAVVENIESDLKEMAALFGWQSFALPHENSSKISNFDLTADERKAVEEANAEDIRYYNEVIRMRKLAAHLVVKTS